jgi:hypothetical protein
MNLTATKYAEIEKWLAEQCIADDFFIRDDGTVDALGRVTIFATQGLQVQFGVIRGTFDISDTHVASISGFPAEIHGDLRLNRTDIVSLSGIDRVVKRVTGCIKVNKYITHTLGLLLIEGVIDIYSGDGRRDDILRKYIGTGDIISAQDELIDAGYSWCARL